MLSALRSCNGGPCASAKRSTLLAVDEHRISDATTRDEAGGPRHRLPQLLPALDAAAGRRDEHQVVRADPYSFRIHHRRPEIGNIAKTSAATLGPATKADLRGCAPEVTVAGHLAG
ncbi:MAG: hypothetical protein R3F59_17635 [Myxococcota bacterium]